MKQLIIISAFILAVGISARAQETFATLELSRTAVYPGEPFRLTVKTFTSTFFLSPITFEDFKVANAFTINFSRTLSGITRVDGKQYATLEFFMQVYPTVSGQMDIPPIKLSFQSPPEGDYKGKLQQIETNVASITIKNIPENSEVNPWFVANQLIMSDQWDKAGQRYKVGDVIERQVLVKAFGTMPNFIPGLSFEDSEGIEVYPKAPELLDKKDDKQAIGWLTQKVLYLLTKEGEVVIPALEINWFNPLTSKANFTRIEALTLDVLPNENLEILETIRDSLQVNRGGMDSVAEENGKIDYRRIGILSLLLFIALFLLWKGIKFLQRLHKRIGEKRKNFRLSAAWYYQQIFKNTQSPVELFNAINTWWDISRNVRQPASITEALKGNLILETWLKLQIGKEKLDKQELKSLLLELTRLIQTFEKESAPFAINP